MIIEVILMKRFCIAILMLFFLCSCQSVDPGNIGNKNLMSTNAPAMTNVPIKVEPKLQNQVEGLQLKPPIIVKSAKGQSFIASDSDYSNLWLLTIESPPHPLIDISTVKEISDKVQEKIQKKEEVRINFIAANNPFPLDQVNNI
jgi:hypothetical protein